jgi:hypothetical protein
MRREAVVQSNGHLPTEPDKALTEHAMLKAVEDRANLEHRIASLDQHILESEQKYYQPPPAPITDEQWTQWITDGLTSATQTELVVKRAQLVRGMALVPRHIRGRAAPELVAECERVTSSHQRCSSSSPA